MGGEYRWGIFLMPTETKLDWITFVYSNASLKKLISVQIIITVSFHVSSVILVYEFRDAVFRCVF
jgi:hypothetical protein